VAGGVCRLPVLSNSIETRQQKFDMETILPDAAAGTLVLQPFAGTSVKHPADGSGDEDRKEEQD
jgi:hypothetical protein